jgi:DME family drug/metabolite transporter
VTSPLVYDLEPAPGVDGERRGDLTGYGLAIGSYLLFGLTPVLVAWADAAESVLLVLRYALAAAVLLLVFAHRRPLAGVLRPGVWQRFVLMALFDSAQVFLYFFAVRALGVAVATFVFFLQPLWVALLAPRLLRVATERFVYVAMAVAFAGLALILAPSLAAGGNALSAAGLAAALAAGGSYALFQITLKRQTRDVSSLSVVALMCVLDCLVFVPLALWQGFGQGRGLTMHDVIAVVIIGLATTALAFTMWVEGVARIRVQHSSILGLLTAVAAPVFAFLLLGQGLSIWVVSGGALILVAGALVVLRGGAEPEPEARR